MPKTLQEVTTDNLFYTLDRVKNGRFEGDLPTLAGAILDTFSFHGLQIAAPEEIAKRDSLKERVIQKFCNLSVEVREYFKNQYGSDCFCEEWKSSLTWTYEDQIFEFIEAAVHEKMENDGPAPSRWEND